MLIDRFQDGLVRLTANFIGFVHTTLYFYV